ncbi:hypothetical protein [Lentzea nigeriaca]|uniref:hypothetical protein n=1 Tax=Lentzea nigeriaca TaxID=1128665 RepID=UPI0019579B15|nr:hypothetical protein [Lentzea nigeriaca]MBM7860420.1 hypothetical protein [Lentzea nigeriaca]
MPREDYGVLPTVDETGLPVGVVDTAAVELQAQRLAFTVGALCLDRDCLRAELGEAVGNLPPEETSMVLAAALRLCLEDLLAPTAELLLKETGTDITVAFKEIATHLPSKVDEAGQ